MGEAGSLNDGEVLFALVPCYQPQVNRAGFIGNSRFNRLLQDSDGMLRSESFPALWLDA